MSTIMLRMIGVGNNAGSGFPAILAWKEKEWMEPQISGESAAAVRRYMKLPVNTGYIKIMEIRMI